MNGRQTYYLTINLRGALLQIFYKLNLEPKTIPELKDALRQIWDDLPHFRCTLGLGPNRLFVFK